MSYNINFATGGGLDFDSNGIKLQGCTTANAVLKWNNTAKTWGCSTDLDTITERIYSSVIAASAGENIQIVDIENSSYDVDHSELKVVACFPSNRTGKVTIHALYSSGIGFANTAAGCPNTLFAAPPAVTMSYDVNCDNTNGNASQPNCNKHNNAGQGRFVLVNSCTASIWGITTKGFVIGFGCASDYQSINLVSMSIMAIVPE